MKHPVIFPYLDFFLDVFHKYFLPNTVLIPRHSAFLITLTSMDLLNIALKKNFSFLLRFSSNLVQILRFISISRILNLRIWAKSDVCRKHLVVSMWSALAISKLIWISLDWRENSSDYRILVYRVGIYSIQLSRQN